MGLPSQRRKAGWTEEVTVMRYAVVIEQAGGSYCAYVPDLPGCIATGGTKAEVEALSTMPSSCTRQACGRTAPPFRSRPTRWNTLRWRLDDRPQLHRACGPCRAGGGRQDDWQGCVARAIKQYKIDMEKVNPVGV
ncbi:type II toxin-antitoxin system HicB family antitoxin [Pseudoxanthomonas sacheonensis]|uniref:type II toxin-antitoxin system HicB family antitoxin n=1 Tax=Pseudoxanthomonas sacheonensis TaxID=443615 RepID=UPI001BAABE00|nr:type II toxin-antitoxin system HicB family antitoxin [Pseudoxanthomonas sacheonensis]